MMSQESKFLPRECMITLLNLRNTLSFFTFTLILHMGFQLHRGLSVFVSLLHASSDTMYVLSILQEKY